MTLAAVVLACYHLVGAQGLICSNRTCWLRFAIVCRSTIVYPLPSIGSRDTLSGMQLLDEFPDGLGYIWWPPR